MRTNVNASQPSSGRRGAAAAAAAAVVLLLVLVWLFTPRGGQQAAAPMATAASPTASATPTSTLSSTASASPTATASPATVTTYQSPLGYSVQLPSGWRRSDLQSRTTPFPPGQGDPDLLGMELFTRLSAADEAEAVRRSDTGVGPPLQYTATVSLYRNSRGLSAMAYAEREKGALGLNPISVEPTTVDGRAGAKTTFKFTSNDPTSIYALYIPDGDRMWVIRYFTGPPGIPIPAGATEAAVRGIVESFRFAR